MCVSHVTEKHKIVQKLGVGIMSNACALSLWGSMIKIGERLSSANHMPVDDSKMSDGELSSEDSKP